ncbi:MAG: Gfo/Idh/MocA family oxidoreductase [Chthonomonas sp.]|nr:Gfo/Idh/MocA family oxidoreductase [Chthonomonas sp.]
MINVGIVGTGGMGRVHANHYRRMPNVQLFAFDANPDALKAYGEQFPTVQTCASFEELLSKSDSVDVCLPTDLHQEIGLKVIAAGRHVMIEKPLARTTAECRTLIEAASKAGVQLAAGQVVRYFAEYRRAHELVAASRVGRVTAARLRRGGKAPTGAGGWFRDFERSGGVLFDLAIHDFDWLSWTLGEVVSVNARAVAFSKQPFADGDYGLATLCHASGAVSHVEATWMDPAGFRVTMEVCGTDGMIQFDSRTTAAVRATNLAGTTFTDNSLTPDQDPYFRQFSSWIAALETGTPYEITPAEAFSAVAIAEAAIESAKKGTSVVPEKL